MPDQFNLETAISQWRDRLVATGLRSRETLDELECHLRDDIEDIVRSGKTLEHAFEFAVVRIGHSVALAEEFSKVRPERTRRPKYLIGFSLISAGLIFWTTTWILAETGVTSVEEGFVFSAIYLVAAYLAALPFSYRKLPSLQNPAAQKAIGITTLFINVWIVLALLNATGKVQFHLPETVVMLFWSIVPALMATILAYDCYKLGRKRLGEADGPESLTAETRRTLDIASEEARKLHHDFVGTEHVLLALLQSGSPGIERVITAFGLDYKTVRAEIETIIQPGSESREQSLPFTPRARRALALAAGEARTMGRAATGLEHIFLGLLLEGKGVAALVLTKLGVDATRVRAEILKNMGPEDGEGPAAVLA